jgi:hypothetical protein
MLAEDDDGSKRLPVLSRVGVFVKPNFKTT